MLNCCRNARFEKTRHINRCCAASMRKADDFARITSAMPRLGVRFDCVITPALQKQAAYLNQTFTLLSSYSFTRAIFWFKLTGPSEYLSNTGVLLYTLDDGLFNQDGTTRPSTAVYQTFASTTIPNPTSSPISPPSPTPSTLPTASSSPSTKPTNSPSPSIPELQNTAVIAVLVASVTVFVFLKMAIHKRSDSSAKTTQRANFGGGFGIKGVRRSSSPIGPAFPRTLLY